MFYLDGRLLRLGGSTVVTIDEGLGQGRGAKNGGAYSREEEETTVDEKIKEEIKDVLTLQNGWWTLEGGVAGGATGGRSDNTGESIFDLVLGLVQHGCNADLWVRKRNSGRWTHRGWHRRGKNPPCGVDSGSRHLTPDLASIDTKFFEEGQLILEGPRDRNEPALFLEEGGSCEGLTRIVHSRRLGKVAAVAPGSRSYATVMCLEGALLEEDTSNTSAWKVAPRLIFLIR
ncbi:hypothetical protein B296_00010675 [Ensete ventricosum]|uniref:Uncharacterized protein n=1 Tax=Ensete ventricosum TaxID=4639 RepID=A0A426Z5Q3_ENSVE|nr:hypothetical protein B296_00010675 [Ensete ventricosum]